MCGSRPTGLGYAGLSGTIARGRLKFGFCLGGNLFGSSPDAEYAAEALSRLDMMVMMEYTLNTGHANGLARQTIILPVLARDEEPEPTTQERCSIMFGLATVDRGDCPARAAKYR